MSNVIWEPQQKQALFMSRPEDEALYGGAAGGGKSDALVIEALRQVEIPHYKGLILRKTYPQLSELIDKSQLYYPRIYPGCVYNNSTHTWRFKSGAKIVFGSMQHSKNKLDYQGKAYDFIAFDELTHFTYDEYIYLSSRNRPNGPGTRCYIRATANPGGIGHGWVKERFITAEEPMKTIWEVVDVNFPDGRTEKRYRSRIFVPSSVFDNKILLQNDPDYLVRLASMPEAQRKALLYGDWDSYSGQFFTEWRNDPTHYKDRRFTHVIEPFDIPSHWPVTRSFDWGFNKPFSCGWWATDTDGITYRICEWYGCTGTPDEGVKMNPHEVFKEIHKIESEHPFLKGRDIYGVADPAIFSSQTGESIAEIATNYGVYFTPGDNCRLPGWLQVRYRLAFDDNGFPMMYCFNTCKNFIRVMPLMQFDDTKIEDLNTKLEDHIADETRYFCMSRPIKARTPVQLDKFYQSPLYTVFDFKKGDLAQAPSHRPEIILRG